MKTDLETEKIITELADLYDIPYENSTTRIKTKFLWLPKRINRKIKWLSKQSWEEKLKQEIDQEAVDLGSLNCLIWVWKPTKWLEL